MQIDYIISCAEIARESLLNLGYDRVDFERIVISPSGDISAVFWAVDEFQRGIDYKHQKQFGHLSLPYPFSTAKLLNREQRELHVLASQTGETKAIAAELASAAGRRFAEQIMESREGIAALCDFSNE